MSEILVTATYRLYSHRDGELVAFMVTSTAVEMVSKDDGLSYEITIPLPSVGATVDFNGVLGIVTERTGAGTDWEVRCVC